MLRSACRLYIGMKALSDDIRINVRAHNHTMLLTSYVWWPMRGREYVCVHLFNLLTSYWWMCSRERVYPVWCFRLENFISHITLNSLVSVIRVLWCWHCIIISQRCPLASGRSWNCLLAWYKPKMFESLTCCYLVINVDAWQRLQLHVCLYVYWHINAISK